MAVMRESDLKAHLSGGEYLPVYFLVGEEKLVLKTYLERMLKKMVPQNFPDFNFNEFNYEADIDKIADAALALPFMADKKCVLVHDYALEEKSAVDRDKLLELVERLPPSTALIFYYPTANVSGKSLGKYKNLYKAIDKVGAIVEFSRKTGVELEKYIYKTAEKNNCRIKKENAQRLVEYVGNDLTAINNELLKLCLYVKEGEITLEHMDAVVSKSVEATVFELSKCILNSDFSKSYELLDKLFYMGEKAVPILAVLSSAFVDIYRVKCSLEAGKSNLGPSEYGDYKGREFRLKYAQRDGRNLSTQKVEECLSLFLKTDFELKSSKLDDKTVLESLIAKLLVITKGG